MVAPPVPTGHARSSELRALLTAIAPNLPGKHYPYAFDVQQFVPPLYPPGTPQPTAAEVERESFVAKGYGQYTIGPGEFDTQTISIHGFGKPMTSNISRKMHFQFVIFEPVNSSRKTQSMEPSTWWAATTYKTRQTLPSCTWSVRQAPRSTGFRPTYFSRWTRTRPARSMFKPKLGAALHCLRQLPDELFHVIRYPWLLRQARLAASGPRRASTIGA